MTAFKNSSNYCTFDPPKNWEEQKRSTWDTLSEDIQLIVLRKLPIFSQIRAKGVSKRWNQLVTSNLLFPSVNFRRSRSATRTVPVYFNHGQLIVFDHRKNGWQEQYLDYLKFPTHSLSLLASAGGLICLKTSTSGELIICNPITMRTKYLTLPEGFLHHAITDPLPDLLKPVVTLEGGKEAIEAFQRSFGKEVIVGLVTERHKQWYKLVIAGIYSTASMERTTLVYDSFTDRWTRGAPVPEGARFWESGKTLAVDGSLYCISFTAGLPSGACNLERPWSILRYCSDKDKWTEIRLGSFGRRPSVLPQLVEQRGRVYVVERDGQTANEISLSELNGGELSKYIYPLPCGLFPPKAGKRCPMIMQDWCVGQGDALYVAARHWKNDGFPRGLVVLACNAVDDVWTQLPTMADDTRLRDHFSATLHVIVIIITIQMLQSKMMRSVVDQ
ncbi:hypothetical protein R1sor_008035 [Riccia sorocarpa]|uniref:F-box domain-containing protein n=1 Tax=Riccia sorocarpa TaxID=122646 RepID=A0ABD3HYH7_9MARC